MATQPMATTCQDHRARHNTVVDSRGDAMIYKYNKRGGW